MPVKEDASQRLQLESLQFPLFDPAQVADLLVIDHNDEISYNFQIKK